MAVSLAHLRTAGCVCFCSDERAKPDQGAHVRGSDKQTLEIWRSAAPLFEREGYRGVRSCSLYSAYTPGLDRLTRTGCPRQRLRNEYLRSVQFVDKPAGWLSRQRGRPLLPGESIPFTVDGRYRWFEAPAAMLQTFCRYRELSSIGSWQVLGLSGGGCGPAEPSGRSRRRTARASRSRSRPVPERFVTVRVHGLEPSLLDRARTALFKADEWYATIAGVGYRRVAPTASDGLLLAVPPSADGTGPFAFGPPIEFDLDPAAAGT